MLSKDTKNDFSSKIVKMVLIIWVAYIAVVGIVGVIHELGHGAVCNSEGFQARIFVDSRGLHSVCFGDVQNEFLHSFAGGLFGLVAASALSAGLFAGLRKVRSAKARLILTPIFAVGLVGVADQILKIALEPFVTQAYLGGQLDGAITAYQVVTLVGISAYVLVKEARRR